jgi:hypothetical protein
MTENEKIWKVFLRRHGKMFGLFVAAAVAAVICEFIVFIWFVGEAQATGLVPSSLGSWTMGYCLTFILHLIFWEIVLVVIPVIIFIVAVYKLWWEKLPGAERKEYKRRKLFGKSTRKTDAGEGISFLVTIFFIIKVYLDGNWNRPFASWDFDYLVYSWLTALMWVLIIFGIPILIGGLWWLNKERKKPQTRIDTDFGG